MLPCQHLQLPHLSYLSLRVFFVVKHITLHYCLFPWFHFFFTELPFYYCFPHDRFMTLSSTSDMKFNDRFTLIQPFKSISLSTSFDCRKISFYLRSTHSNAKMCFTSLGIRQKNKTKFKTGYGQTVFCFGSSYISKSFQRVPQKQQHNPKTWHYTNAALSFSSFHCIILPGWPLNTYLGWSGCTTDGLNKLLQIALLIENAMYHSKDAMSNACCSLCWTKCTHNNWQVHWNTTNRCSQPSAICRL